MTDPFERMSAALADRYGIERELGRGGMATVYLERTTVHAARSVFEVVGQGVEVWRMEDYSALAFRLSATLAVSSPPATAFAINETSFTTLATSRPEVFVS